MQSKRCQLSIKLKEIYWFQLEEVNVALLLFNMDASVITEIVVCLSSPCDDSSVMAALAMIVPGLLL